jgi:hypothetical protein
MTYLLISAKGQVRHFVPRDEPQRAATGASWPGAD